MIHQSSKPLWFKLKEHTVLDLPLQFSSMTAVVMKVLMNLVQFLICPNLSTVELPYASLVMIRVPHL